ncbi:12688_t:CDS:2, partial [Gigaspora rosea]
TSLLELETDYSITLNEITSSNLEGTIAFDNNDIELDTRNEEILEGPDIIPGPATNENNKTTLETVDRTQDQRATITGIINDLTEEKEKSEEVKEKNKRLMKNSLGLHKMYNFWKGAHRINQVLQSQELPQ